MKIKTAAIFAGIDALDVEEHRLSAFAIPEVRRRVLEAEEALNKFGAEVTSIQCILQSRDAEYFSLDLFARTIACIAVQVGLFDKYIASNPTPEYFAACSLGDSARLVASGAASFEEVIVGNYLFGKAAKKIKDGAIIRVRSKVPMDPSSLSFLEHFGLSVAVYQTPRHFLVAGQISDLQNWAAISDPRIDQIKPLYEYPLHSKLMRPAFEEIYPMVDSQSERTWSGHLISAALIKVLRTTEDIRLDAAANTMGTVHWHQTYRWMVDDLGVEQFVNIGPTPTLLLFAARTPVSQAPLFRDGLNHEHVNPYKKEETGARNSPNVQTNS